MNKKMMALIMSALMVMAAFVIVVAAPSDAAGSGTENDPKYIIGSDTTAVVVYKDDILKGSIEFNRSAFTEHAVVDLDYDGVTANDMSIEDSVKTTGKGKVTINTSDVKTLNGKIILKVDDIVKVPGGTDIPLPQQKFYYAINVEIKDSDTIYLADDTGELVKDQTSNNYTDTFDFEKDVNITASAKTSSGGDSSVTYKYYATGLPTGLSMKVDGKIGGKIGNTYSTGDTGNATIYGVSDTGAIIKTVLEWKIGAIPVKGNFTMKATQDDTSAAKDVDDKGYIAIKSGFESVLTITPTTGFNATKTEVVGYDGVDITKEADDTYKIKNDGTGTFLVKVTVDLENNTVSSWTTTVTKTFTVYVTGAIVDVDLDPAVTSL